MFRDGKMGNAYVCSVLSLASVSFEQAKILAKKQVPMKSQAPSKEKLNRNNLRNCCGLGRIGWFEHKIVREVGVRG